LPRLNALGVKIAGRITGKVRVVELVGGAVPHPQPPAAHLVPPDAVDRSARDGDDRGAERREDVIAVVPFAVDVAAEAAVGIVVVSVDMLVVVVADPVVVVVLVDVDVEVDVEDVVVVGALVVVVSVVVGGESAKAAAATPMAKSSAPPRTAITFSSGMGRSM